MRDDELARTSPWELLQNPWVVQKEALRPISAYLRGGGVTEAQAEEATAEQAAMRSASVDLYGGVAVISIRGLIMPGMSLLGFLLGGCSLQRFRAELREAVSNDEVNSILLDVNSPGGYIDLIPETAAEIREAAVEKTVVAVANTSAASAAYWLASQASQVIVTPSGQVGSVGVYTLHEDWSKYDEELGVKTTLISAGKHKTEGNPYEPLSEEAEAEMQGRVNETCALFHAEVAKGRGSGVTAKKVATEFGEGRMVRAKDAVSRGMADKVDTFEATLTRLARGGRSAGGGRKGLQLKDHITSVLTEVDGVIDRAADVVTKRAEQGKALGSESRELLEDLEPRLERLKGVLSPEPTQDDETAANAQQEYLRHLARESKGATP